MSQMTPEQLAQHNEALAIMKKENEIYARDALQGIKDDLAIEANPKEAVYLYLYMQDFSELLDQEAEPFETVAPMVKLNKSEYAAVELVAAAEKSVDQKEARREINMSKARKRMETAIQTFGEDSDESRMAMANAIQYLPADLKAGVDAKARELGLMPAASGYTADNEPVFTVEALAKHFDMEPEQVMQDAGEFAMTVDASTIHRTQ